MMYQEAVKDVVTNVIGVEGFAFLDGNIIAPFHWATTLDIRVSVNQHPMEELQGDCVRVYLTMDLPTTTPQNTKLKVRVFLSRNLLDGLFDENTKDKILEDIYWVFRGNMMFDHMKMDYPGKYDSQILPEWFPQQM